MLGYFAFIAVGLLLLFAGAEGLVRGSSALALRLGVTPLVVGLTVVAFGTSSPELVVSVRAVLDGSGPIALGNVIGSNICNIALILGLSAMIRPMKVNLQVIRTEIPVMIGVSLILLLFLIDGMLGRLESFLLFAGIVFYTGFNIFKAGKERDKLQEKELVPGGIPGLSHKFWLCLIFIIAGLVMLAAGASFLVKGAVGVAQSIGISQAVIGLTIISAGTSLPELITSVVASVKNQEDIAIGNVVGSNIFNILAILGIAGLVHPIEAGSLRFGNLIVMVLTAILMLPLARTGFLLNRIEGAFLFTIYVGYIYFLIINIL